MSFPQRLLETLKALLTSKKVITALVGFVVTVAAKRGIVLSPDDVNSIVAIFAVLIGAQGAADLGKSAALIQAAAPNPPDAVTQTVTVVPDKK